MYMLLIIITSLYYISQPCDEYQQEFLSELQVLFKEEYIRFDLIEIKNDFDKNLSEVNSNSSNISEVNLKEAADAFRDENSYSPLHIKTTSLNIHVEQSKQEIDLCFNKANIPDISIDMDKNVIIIDGERLKFIKEISVSNENNILRSKWEGGLWKSAGEQQISLIIGKLLESENIYISLENYSSKMNKNRYKYRLRSIEK